MFCIILLAKSATKEEKNKDVLWGEKEIENTAYKWMVAYGRVK